MAKGLSAESITVAAAELIEQYGRSGFSMRLLADTMGVKTASLYNHIENMDTPVSYTHLTLPTTSRV